MRAPWWEHWTGRLDREFAELETAGIRFIEIPGSRDAGVIELELWFTPPGGDEIHLRATYPDAFPYTRPDVAAIDLALGRHQHPFAKNLCLLPRGTENWDIDTTLARYITERVPAVLAAVEAAEAGLPSPVPEQRQGEPFSDYYRTEEEAIVLIDTTWEIDPAVRSGTMRLAINERSGPLRAAVELVLGPGREVLAAADPAMLRAIPNQRNQNFRWVRADPPPPQAPDGSLALFDKALLALEQEAGRHRPATKFGRETLDVTGVLFREEVADGRFGDGWIFRVQRFNGHIPQKAYLARAGRAGRDDLRARTPETQALADKTVLVIGVGGIGAPAAIELARAGLGRLRLIDHDVVDPGTAVRWPFGLEDAGKPKVKVLTGWLTRNLPYTQVEWATARLGAVRPPGPGLTEGEILGEMFAGADLVLDATAEYGLHVYIADLAREFGITYVEASTRPGAWGGVVARIRPSHDRPCWICYANTLRDLEAAGCGPAADPAGFTQPLGCADPTFTGIGFDVAEFGLIAARMVTSTLVGGTPGGYPDPAWDLGVVNLRSREGILTTPEWTVSPLDIHPDCPRHGSRAA